MINNGLRQITMLKNKIVLFKRVMKMMIDSHLNRNVSGLFGENATGAVDQRFGFLEK